MRATGLKARRDRAANEARRSRVPAWIGRAGLVGRGLLYVLVGWLAIAIATGDQSEHADQRGAIAYAARQPVGKVLVVVLAVLFAAYALYQLTQGLLDPERDGRWRRPVALTRSLVYVSLSAGAFSTALGDRAAPSSGEEQQSMTSTVLGWPGGRYLVAAVALGVMSAGAYRGWQVVTGRVADDLKHEEMPEGVEGVAKAAGSIGELARMVAFALVGGFLLRAAWTFDPTEPIGLDESLHRTAQEPWGPAALTVVGVGLLAYGLYALGRARYERVMGR